VAITQFRGGVVKRGLRRIARVFHLISDALRQSPEDICIMYFRITVMLQYSSPLLSAPRHLPRSLIPETDISKSTAQYSKGKLITLKYFAVKEHHFLPTTQVRVYGSVLWFRAICRQFCKHLGVFIILRIVRQLSLSVSRRKTRESHD